MSQPEKKALPLSHRTGGLVLPGHRVSRWYWHRPLTDSQIIRLYDSFRNQPEPTKTRP